MGNRIWRAVRWRAAWRGLMAGGLVLAPLLMLTGCARDSRQVTDPLDVVATVAPLADWARNVGGERVRVETVVPVGENPITYVPTPEQVKAIQAADVVILNGLGLEPWIEEILDQAEHHRLIVLDISLFTGPLTERVPVRVQRFAAEPGGTSGNPLYYGETRMAPAPVYSRYLWLDPQSARTQVSLIAQTLTRADPDGLVVFRQNAARYNGELENLDNALRRQIDSWKRRAVVGQNRFLYPFTKHFNVRLSLLDTLTTRLSGVQREPLVIDQLTASNAAPPANASDRSVVVLNPLASANYIELMRTNVQTMTEVMRS